MRFLELEFVYEIFRVFRNIKLHFFFYFSYFLILRYEIFDSEIAFPVLMPP